MTHGSLFSGIGGFDLAAQWMSWETIFQCEKDAFCRKILKYYWPNTICYEEIRKFRAIEYKDRVGVLSGGFPCQPYSLAGRRLGTKDDRHLWPEMYRIVGEVRPRWVVAENVLGLLNWRRGLVFEQVQADLEALGYEVWSFVLPAAGVGAPHRRERVWIIAYSGCDGFGWDSQFKKGGKDWCGERSATACGPDRSDGNGIAANADNALGFKGWLDTKGSKISEQDAIRRGAWSFREAWNNFPSQPAVFAGNDGLSARMDRVALSKWRVASLRGAGNAIVPQVALRIFQTIEGMEKLMTEK